VLRKSSFFRVSGILAEPLEKNFYGKSIFQKISSVNERKREFQDQSKRVESCPEARAQKKPPSNKEGADSPGSQRCRPKKKMAGRILPGRSRVIS